MMAEAKFKFGDLVDILRLDWIGSVGIVTQPISEEKSGHVLIYSDDSIVGMDVSVQDVKLADESSAGFAQLGYHLIKLGSLVIEKKLLVYR